MAQREQPRSQGLSSYHTLGSGKVRDPVNEIETWVEFVVGSHLAPMVFLRVPGFPSSTRTTSPNSNPTRIEKAA